MSEKRETPWTITERHKAEGTCGPGLWIRDPDGRTVVDTGNLEAWPLSERHRAMIAEAPAMAELLADLANSIRALDEDYDQRDSYRRALALLARIGAP
jgi:hypothetical protein